MTETQKATLFFMALLIFTIALLCVAALSIQWKRPEICGHGIDHGSNEHFTVCF